MNSPDPVEKTIRKAIKEGLPAPQSMQDKILEKDDDYSHLMERLKKLFLQA